MKIIHKDGDWFQNFGAYPFVDAESGVLFEPMVATKARATLWLEAQSGIIKRIPDPLAKPEAETPAAKPEVEAQVAKVVAPTVKK